MIRPLIEEGKVSSYTASPTYQGASFVPTAIDIAAFDPGAFTTSIDIWGEALTADGCA